MTNYQIYPVGRGGRKCYACGSFLTRQNPSEGVAIVQGQTLAHRVCRRCVDRVDPGPVQPPDDTEGCNCSCGCEFCDATHDGSECEGCDCHSEEE